jgi:hypothetical protein
MLPPPEPAGCCIVTTQRDKNGVLPRAVTYLRFAVADGDGRREDIAKHACQRRANELGAIVVSTYTDTASGLIADRPQLRRILSDLSEASEITYVIVPGHSTIATDMRLYGRITWMIDQTGARLIVATTPLENYRTMAPNQLGVLHAVASWATSERQFESGTTEEGEPAPPPPGSLPYLPQQSGYNKWLRTAVPLLNAGCGCCARPTACPGPGPAPAQTSAPAHRVGQRHHQGPLDLELHSGPHHRGVTRRIAQRRARVDRSGRAQPRDRSARHPLTDRV